MSCDALVSLALLGLGGGCEVLCKHSVVVYRKFCYHLFVKELITAKELPVNVISKLLSLFWRCPLPKCYSVQFPSKCHSVYITC